MKCRKKLPASSNLQVCEPFLECRFPNFIPQIKSAGSGKAAEMVQRHVTGKGGLVISHSFGIPHLVLSMPSLQSWNDYDGNLFF